MLTKKEKHEILLACWAIERHNWVPQVAVYCYLDKKTEYKFEQFIEGYIDFMEPDDATLALLFFYHAGGKL